MRRMKIYQAIVCNAFVLFYINSFHTVGLLMPMGCHFNKVFSNALLYLNIFSKVFI